jgi:hypothetical protein
LFLFTAVFSLLPLVKPLFYFFLKSPQAMRLVSFVETLPLCPLLLVLFV